MGNLHLSRREKRGMGDFKKGGDDEQQGDGGAGMGE